MLYRPTRWYSSTVGSFFSLRATLAQSSSSALSAGLNPGPIAGSPASSKALRRPPTRLYTAFSWTPAIRRSSRRFGLRPSFPAHTRTALRIVSLVMIHLARLDLRKENGPLGVDKIDQ